jgi:hypothetical protein
MTRNIFVVGLDDENRQLLESVRNAGDYAFHRLLPYGDIRGAAYDVEALLAEGRRQLDTFPGRVDAIIGYIDFPVSTILPLLRRHAGLGGPSFESVMFCEHKYWSRLLQKRVIPDNVPPFQAVDPFSGDAADRIELDFPFWLKPVKAFLSQLGFRIESRAQLEHALAEIRAGIERFGAPFNHLLQYAEMPPDLPRVDGNQCIAEAIIGGRQCTIEGYVFHGMVHVYGVVDSHRAPNGSSFTRYQYPSELPQTVLWEMDEAASKALAEVGFDDGPFNIEFFWDEDRDQLWLLEINPRMSKAHSHLFEMVAGVSHHEVAVDLALGQEPRFPQQQGQFACAAKFMVRDFEHGPDARVTRVPTEAELDALVEAFPEAAVDIKIQEGMRLGDLHDQDSYSFELAELHLGGASTDELLDKYERCLARLPIQVEKP